MPGMTKPAALVVLLSLYGSPLFGRPEFLLRYASDPFSRPELRTCSTCHVNPEGSGPRNAFGRAFDRNDHRVTPGFRLQWPDHFRSTISAELTGPQQAPLKATLKATWAAGKEEEVLVEIGSQQYLLNRAEGTVKKLEAAEAQAFRTPPPVPLPAAEPEEVLERRPTFDYYLVNLPTNRMRPPRSLHMRFTHRFSDPPFKGTGRLRDLFGFDSLSRSSFGIEMGLLRRVSFVTYRTPYFLQFPPPCIGDCAVGGPTIEMGPVFHLLHERDRDPLSLSLRTTVEGQANFTQRYTVNLVPVVSRSIGDRAELFVVPTFNLNVPRRTLTFDSPRTPGEIRDHLVSVGVGASIRIRPRTALIVEWRPRVAGFRGRLSRNTFAFGIQRSTNRHVFALTFSNTQSTTTTRSLTDGLDDLRIGFNLYRRLW